MHLTLRLEARHARGGLSSRSLLHARELIVVRGHGGPFDGRVAKTLYDLLGASPSDDAEGLRDAFRKAVKASHPDLHRDDPFAAVRLSGVLRAYAILRDASERAAYDQALEFEREPPRPKPNRTFLNTVQHIFAEAGTIAVLAVVLGGGYMTVATVLSQFSEDDRLAQVRGSTRIAIVNIPAADATTASPSAPSTEEPGDVEIPRPVVSPAARVAAVKSSDALEVPSDGLITSAPAAGVVHIVEDSGAATSQVEGKAAATDHVKSTQEVEGSDQDQDSKAAPNAVPSVRVELSALEEHLTISQSPSPELNVPNQRGHGQAPGSRSSEAKDREIATHGKRRAAAAIRGPQSHASIKQASLENKGVQPCAESPSCSGKSSPLLGVGF